MSEQIIAIPREKLGFLPDQTIITDDVKRLILEMEPHYGVYDRDTIEPDSSYRQLIPYVVIRKGNKFLCMGRKKGDARLVSKWSIGAGGHMNPVEGITSLFGLIDENMRRELEEELVILSTGKKTLQPIGLIKDDSDDVSRCHLGVLFILNYTEVADIRIRETDILEGVWMTKTALRNSEYYDKLESWSKKSLDLIIEKHL